MAIRNLKNKRFGMLVPLEPLDEHLNTQTYWKCQCDCGKVHLVRARALIFGNTKSCGCAKAERAKVFGKKNITHGLTKTVEYKTWGSMKTRCYNPKSENYKDYGGRGIVVCDRWKYSFENFLADMGKRPGPGYSLERLDSNKNYEPDNCKWATIDEQNNNKRSNIIYELDGKRRSLGRIAKDYGIPRATLATRLKGGWSIEKAVSQPKQKREYTYKGETKTIGEWAKFYGIEYHRFYNRLMAGLPFEYAILRTTNATSELNSETD